MDLMQRRRELMAMQTGGLPGAYRQVEYLESTGTQVIYTDIPAQLPISTSCDLIFTSAQDSYFFGTRGNNIRLCSCGYANDYQWQWAFGVYRLWRGIQRNSRYVFNTYLSNGLQILSLDENEVVRTEYVINEPTSGQGFGNYALFAYRNEDNNSFGQFAKAKCYGVKVWNGNDVLLANFIPCVRKFDSKPGMYDTVTKQFFTNAGTGEFIVPA